MSTTPPTNPILYYGVGWVLRLVTNLIKFSLWASFVGTLMFVMILVYVVMTTGESGTSNAPAWMTAIMANVLSVLGEGSEQVEISGGMDAFGLPVLRFVAPYLVAIDVVVSVAEAWTGKSLFRWFRWSLLSRLVTLLVVFVGLALASIYASDLPHTELAYWVRVLIVVVLYAWAAGQLLVIHIVSVASESLFNAFTRRYGP